MIKPQTLKGFRDFLPADAIKRQYVINKIKNVFERFGFDPLETPALEYAETLLGKYGNEADKLLYIFKDNGDRNVGLRYDQTVPLSRVVAQYQHELPTPFKRYQIQPVWRAENTQKGRFREFLQCDIDTIGTDSPAADAEIIACTITALKELEFHTPQIWINDRKIFDDLGLSKNEIIILDKLEKIGKEAMINELGSIGTKNPTELWDHINNSKQTERLKGIVASLEKQGFIQGIDFVFSPFLARGLEYYTSTIFEAKIPETTSLLSVAGGGRYDKLIGQFSGRDEPAVGIAFGFDRIIEILEENILLPDTKTATQALVTVFSPELFDNAIEIAHTLRADKINTEVYLETDKLEKQLKYADRKGIPYVIIQGPEEMEKGVVKLKDMKAKTQEELTVEEVIQKLCP